MSQLLERMTSILWLALASSFLPLSSTEQQGEYSARLASQMTLIPGEAAGESRKCGSGSVRRQGHDKNLR